ncbi:MAG: phycobilisome rod-core linker polypeptide [Cyanobacteriota bacterium]|nr:phycobilisome rod-core linker polypeptide [Cyanobacteriota bacterium]
MGSLSAKDRLPFNPSSQNSRVDSISASRQRCLDRTSELAPEIIERCYRQIYFHAMSCDRDRFLESQFRSGSITVRDFIRGLLLSERFYRGYVECNGNDRIVEQVIGRVLGRPVYGLNEMKSWSIVIAEQGFAAFVDAILDSPEYFERFGNDGIPEQVNRVLPGRSQGEIPIYQRLPRYGESWRERLVRDGLMISVDAFNKIGRTMTVSRLIYEKPEGRLFKLWLIFLVVLGTGSISLVLLVFHRMFTI